LIKSNEEINLSVTHPHYGGVRYWINCPECGNRVGKLYKPDESNEFKCRSCHNLIYLSQESNVYDGWLKKVRNSEFKVF
jgi:peptide subunit release factor 1 (eRF1)